MAIAVAERVRDKNRNTMLQFRSMEKRAAALNSSSFLMQNSSFLYFTVEKMRKLLVFHI